MAVREILTIPDPALKIPADPVTEITDAVRAVLQDLSDTVDNSPGVALAAPQIGESICAICVDVSQDKRKDTENHGKVLLVNPVIDDQSEPDIIREGCLSVPEYTADVRRFNRVTVSGLSPDGREREISTSGWEAVAFQHEIDHLDGILFLDRIARIRQDLFERKSS